MHAAMIVPYYATKKKWIKGSLSVHFNLVHSTLYVGNEWAVLKFK